VVVVVLGSTPVVVTSVVDAVTSTVVVGTSPVVCVTLLSGWLGSTVSVWLSKVVVGIVVDVSVVVTLIPPVLDSVTEPADSSGHPLASASSVRRERGARVRRRPPTGGVWGMTKPRKL